MLVGAPRSKGFSHNAPGDGALVMAHNAPGDRALLMVIFDGIKWMGHIQLDASSCLNFPHLV